jgi:CBS domain-containing protein
MDIGSVMKREVVWLKVDATMGEAIELMIDHRIGLIPLVDEQKRLQGILNLRDILSLAWPSFIDVIENFDFVHDFGASETSPSRESLRTKPVSEFMQTPTFVTESCGILRAAAVMSQHRLRDIPVVDAEDHLIGLASWVDVGIAFLQEWVSPDDVP